MNWSKPYVGVDPVSGWRPEDPCSVVPKEWELPRHPLGYAGHRKGHGKPGDRAFIPLWLLTCLPVGNRVFFVLRPGETRASFWDYAGMTPEMAAALVAEGRLIPQIYVPPEEFGNSQGGATFAPVLATLVRERLPLAHANAFETLLARHHGLVGETGVWADLKATWAGKLPDRAFTAAQAVDYTAFREREPVAPAVEGLKGFVAERMAWQALERASAGDAKARKAAQRNLNRLARAWRTKGPEGIYWTGNLAHFGVTSRYYCRDGFAWRTEQDVRQLVEFNGAFRCAFGDTGARASAGDRVEIRLRVPRLAGDLEPSKSIPGVQGVLDFFRRNVWGSDVDRFWHRARVLQARSRPGTVFGWHEDVVASHLKDQWEPLVESHTNREAWRTVARLRTTQLLNATPTLMTLSDMVQEKAEEAPGLDEVVDLMYLVKDVAASRKDAGALAAAGLVELAGHASLVSRRAAMGGVLEPTLATDATLALPQAASPARGR